MVLIQIALRNLLSHKIKSLVVGTLLVFGTILLIAGQSLLASLDRSMAQSIVNSISGHIQVSSDKGKDKLAIFGGFEGNEIGHIEDFPKVRKALESLPEVASVIPMGIDNAVVFSGNILDVKLAELRLAEKAKDRKRIESLREHIHRIVGLLQKELKNLQGFTDVNKMSPEMKQGLLDVDLAAKPEFWATFDQDPFGHMELLENKIAPMAMGEDMMFLRYIGTDTQRFVKAFGLFEMVEGTPIPPGQRGFLFNKLTYDEQVKHKTARRLDKMKERMAEGYAIATDTDLQEWVKLNRTQYKEVTYQLDEDSALAVRTAFQQELKSGETHLEKLVDGFMTMTDANFAHRYKVFYDVVAPRIRLYSIRIGDTMTIAGLTSGGYPTNVNVKVYGTFRFRSLDKSALAGAANLVDLMSFRDLYGYMTTDRKEELVKLEKLSGVKHVARETAEDELFGGTEEAAPTAAAESPTGVAADVSPSAVAGDASPTSLASNASPTGGFDEFKGLDMKESARRYGAELGARVYSQTEVDGGIVRNAAVMLKPDADLSAAMQHIIEVSKRDNLGLRVVDWREASGMIGTFVGVIYAVLTMAVLVIFIVTLVIMNNSMVMATMERTREIGTLRAIGAQRSEILKMFLIEAVVLGSVFGLIGTLVGGGIVAYFHTAGLPAVNDVMVFLFAGPRLFPFLAPTHVVVAIGLVVFITVVSTLYPALLATRVTPLSAMQESE